MKFFSLKRLQTEYKCLKKDGKIALAIYAMAFCGVFMDAAIKKNEPQYREKIDYGLDAYFLIILAITMLYVPLRVDQKKLHKILEQEESQSNIPRAIV